MNCRKEKSIRLKNYDYSTAGAYFVTMCVQGRKRILSEFVGPNDSAVNTTGAFHAVGEDLDPPGMRLKPIGEVVVEQCSRVLASKKWMTSSMP